MTKRGKVEENSFDGGEGGLATEEDESRSESYDQLLQIANSIIQIAGKVGLGENQEKDRKVSKERVLQVAERLSGLRKSRYAFLPREIFGEPSWDILLDLFIAALKGEDRLVKQLCLAAQVPSTTALRYISKLEECGVIRRISDKVDRRRIYISLTKYGFNSMNNLVSCVCDLEKDDI